MSASIPSRCLPGFSGSLFIGNVMVFLSFLVTNFWVIFCVCSHQFCPVLFFSVSQCCFGLFWWSIRPILVVVSENYRDMPFLRLQSRDPLIGFFCLNKKCTHIWSTKHDGNTPLNPFKTRDKFNTRKWWSLWAAKHQCKLVRLKLI